MSGKKLASARQWQEVLRWLHRVDQDLDAIDALLRASLVDPAALHCQQAAEKLAKAFIVAMGALPSKTHDIDELADVAVEHDPEFAGRLRQLGSLTRWYVWVRYPAGGETGPTSEDVAEAYAGILELRRQIQIFAPKPGE